MSEKINAHKVLLVDREGNALVPAVTVDKEIVAGGKNPVASGTVAEMKQELVTYFEEKLAASGSFDFSGATDFDSSALLAGDKGFNSEGQLIEGKIIPRSLNEVTMNDNVVSIPAGSYPESQTKVVGTALAAKSYTPGDAPIVIKAGHFLTGDQTINAVQTGGGFTEVYRCTEYDSGEAIPAYSNITVSGITSDAAANGAMTLLDRTTSGGNRLWGKDSYRLGYDSYNGYWCFYNSSNVFMPWADSAMFKAKCWITTNAGTKSNMINWHDVTNDNTHTVTKFLNTKDVFSGTSDSAVMYFKLKLKAGVEYAIGMTKGTIYSTQVNLVDKDGTWIDNWYDSVDVGGITIAGKKYTPSQDEIIYVTAGYETTTTSYMGTFQMHCYPAPEVLGYVNKEPWQCTWEEVTGTGSLTLATQEVAERPATGVKVWSGYTGTQNASTKEWNFSNEVKSNMSVQGITPKVGNVYTEDTSLQIAGTYTIPPADGKMVALFHYDKKQSVFVDSTETCMMTTDNQWYVSEDNAKFGRASWFYNYMNFYTGMGGKIIGLPELDAFTIEFWHWYDAYYDKFGGPLIISENDENNYGEYGATWLSGVNFQEGSPFYSKKRWFHHALVREAGSQMVTEYIDGKPAAMYQFAPKLGGGRGVWVCAGGVEMGQSGNIGNRMDELAIFNYARYHGEFTPPTEPYADVISGLGRQKGEPRQVEVSGITGIVFANDPGYNLVNPQATGNNRKWVTADGAWYIYFDWDMDYCWVIANKTSAWGDGYVCAARLVDNENDQSDASFNPIGHPGWVDSYTNAKVTVRQLREPAEGDLAYDRITLTGAGEENVNGTYWLKPYSFKVGAVTQEGTAYFNGSYGISVKTVFNGGATSYDMSLYVVYPEDTLYDTGTKQNGLYSCSLFEMYNANKQWDVLNGKSPAPRTTFG